MEKFLIKTYGCKINQYDSAILRAHFTSLGLEETNRIEEADHIIINTCVVTHRAERDARHFLNRVGRLKKAGTKVYLTGCGANYLPQPGVDFFGDFQSLSKVLGITRIFPEFSRSRPFVKVQEGCDFKCTYCVVPQVRGGSQSRKLKSIIDEIKFHLDNGAKEIVLTGTQIGDWGKEWGKNLDELIEEIVDLEGDFRVRISSMAPIHVSDNLIELFKNHPDRLAPHFHISLQSGSAKVLKDMKRPYTIEKYTEIIWKIYESIENVAIGTDIIVGFPTEIEEDFEQTVKVVDTLPFAYLHVFEYSPRPGTDAYRLGDIPSQIKKKRVHELLKLVEKKRMNFKKSNLGKRLRVLIENRKNGYFYGTSENYMRVLLKSEKLQLGEFVRAKVTEIHDHDRDVIGEIQ